MTLNPELQKVVDDCEHEAERAKQLFQGLEKPQLTARPKRGRWSIVECVAHLNLIGEIHLRALDVAIDEALRNRIYGSGPFRYNWISRKFISSTEPPPKIRIKAPKRIKPVKFVLKNVLPDFLKLQNDITLRALRAEPLDLVRVKVPFPFFRPFRLNLGAYFEQALAHERRHLWQAEQVRAAVTNKQASTAATSSFR